MSIAAAEVPAASATPGGSFLTQGLPDAPPPKPAAEQPGPENGIDTVAKAIKRPEWAPEKYWDQEKNELRQEDLAKGYTSLEKLLGHEKVPKPLNPDDKEGWERWYAAGGRPETADKYEFERPEQLPDGLEYDEDMETSYRTFVFENGLNGQQAANIYDRFVKHQIERHGAYQVHQKQALAKLDADLRREYGREYEGTVGKAKQLVETYADPDFKQALIESGYGNDPRMIRMFARIGKEMSGDQRLQGKPTPGITPADAQRAIAEHTAKFKTALFDRSHPEHKLRVEERIKLFEIAHPEQPA